MIYVIFAKAVRPDFICLLGPIIPFTGYFWVIRNESDKECGGIKELELSIVNYLYLFITYIGQIMVITLIIAKYRNRYKE